MNNLTSLEPGDPVNWDVGDRVVFGFADEHAPPRTHDAKKIRVRDTQDGVWQIEFGKLRPTD